ncbi:MAG: hypothetical protein JXR19_07785 [Bacteroidia bacterium]
MKIAILIAICLSWVNSLAQDEIDSALPQKNLIGSWKVIHVIDYDTNGVATDTITSDSFQATFYILLTADSIQEYMIPWLKQIDDSEKIVSDKGSWIISRRNNSNWIDFDCFGVFIGGLYQVISLENNILIIEACSLEPLEACQHTVLKKVD